MLDTAQNVFLIALGVVLSLMYLFLINRLWDPIRRQIHNSVIGWQISILGVIYAVIIGFMVGSVWGNYQAAETNVESEANALVNLFRCANGLPPAQRDAIHNSAHAYATAVLTKEWPAMRRAEIPQAGTPYIRDMWRILVHTRAEDSVQQTSLSQSLVELSHVSLHRRVRILDSRSGMPNILWAVLLIGGAITTTACCLIGTENVALHFALIFALALLISITLVAIADIDRSFQGSVRVESSAFVRAQETMRTPAIAQK